MNDLSMGRELMERFKVSQGKGIETKSEKTACFCGRDVALSIGFATATAATAVVYILYPTAALGLGLTTVLGGGVFLYKRLSHDPVLANLEKIKSTISEERLQALKALYEEATYNKATVEQQCVIINATIAMINDIHNSNRFEAAEKIIMLIKNNGIAETIQTETFINACIDLLDRTDKKESSDEKRRDENVQQLTMLFVVLGEFFEQKNAAQKVLKCENINLFAFHRALDSFNLYALTVPDLTPIRKALPLSSSEQFNLDLERLKAPYFPFPKRFAIANLSEQFEKSNDNDQKVTIIKAVFDMLKNSYSKTYTPRTDLERDTFLVIRSWSVSVLSKPELEVCVNGFTNCFNSLTEEQSKLENRELLILLTQMINVAFKPFLQKQLGNIRSYQINYSEMENAIKLIYSKLPKDQNGDAVREEIKKFLDRKTGR